MRTNVYVDTFNLYYGCLKNTAYRWLDISKLCQSELPANDINRIRCFAARVKGRPGDLQQPDRQNAYFRALLTIPNLTIHEGQYLATDVRMALSTPFPISSVDTSIVTVKPDGTQLVEVRKSEEKGSDVNPASYLLLDGFRKDYEVAVVITNDSDLAEPIRLVRHELKLPVVVLHPCGGIRGPSIKLKMVASKSISISEIHLAASLFPDEITLPNGQIITKPVGW